ncbi:MAG: hypothetical protein QM535_20745 [Limnohabitans sp.]|nr:hypothetical protein [Limnohabitans sp.]
MHLASILPTCTVGAVPGFPCVIPCPAVILTLPSKEVKVIDPSE